MSADAAAASEQGEDEQEGPEVARRVLVGVTGSVAAIKVPELVEKLCAVDSVKVWNLHTCRQAWCLARHVRYV